MLEETDYQKIPPIEYDLSSASYVEQGDLVYLSYMTRQVIPIEVDLPVAIETPTLLRTVTVVELTSENIAQQYFLLNTENQSIVVQKYLGGWLVEGIDYSIELVSGEMRKFSWETSLGLVGEWLPQVGDQVILVTYTDGYSLQPLSLSWSETPATLEFNRRIPEGLQLQTNGLLYGVPTTSGEYNWRLTVWQGDKTTVQDNKTTIIEKSLALENSKSTTGDGINHTNLTSFLGLYPAQLQDIELEWIGGSVRVDYTLISTSNNNTLEFPGLVQFTLESDPLEKDWIDAPIHVSSTTQLLDGDPSGVFHTTLQQPLYIPLLQVIKTPETYTTFKVRLAIAEQDSYSNGVPTRVSNYYYSPQIIVSDKLWTYSRARKNRAILDGLIDE